MVPDSGPATDRGRATPAERRLALLWALALAAALALKPLWLALAPFLPDCQFRRLTGIPCPTCVATRAAAAALQGHLGAAFALNPLMTALALLLAAGALLAPLWVLSGRPLPRPSRTVPRWAWRTAGLILLLNWVYLIATR
jgi:hypothetical protein